MSTNIYKTFSTAKQTFFSLALILFSLSGSAQSTYTFFYTGTTQSLSLSAGTFSIDAWGGDGYTQTSGFNGKAGYATGILTLTSPQVIYIYVGGLGGYPSSGVNANTWTFNGGGIGYPSANSAYGNGGGASDVRLVGGSWDNTTSLASRAIVAGGGGAGRNSSYIGGNGGGLTGGTGTYFSPDQTGGPTGGTQTGGGSNTGYTSGLTPATLGKAMTWDGNTLTANFLAGGGGGYYGGASGRVAGGGGSSYIGGVSSGTTIMIGQAGFVPNPDLTGNGRVIIKELCTFNLYATGSTNSLSPTICAGQSLTLMTNAVSNYSWSTGANTSSLVVAPTTNTVYTLTALSPSNCTTSRTISVTVSAGLPVLAISNPSNNICLGRTATLTASGALSYTWANAGVVNGQTFTPQSTANYTVFGANGCGTSTAVTTITVDPLPVFVTSSSSLVCEGSTTTLTAVSAVNGYTWQPGAQTAPTAIVAPTISTIYTVTASDGICAGTQTILVTTKTTPSISITPTLVSLCLGETTTLTANGAGSGGSYAWTPGSGNTSAIAVSPATSTLYIVSGTNSLNCTATAQVPVVVVQPLPLNVTANTTLVCSGATVNLSATGSTSYSWTNGPATAAYQVNPIAAFSIYTVTGFNTTNTCTATRTIAIAAIIPSVNVTTPVSMCEGGSATVTASGATTYTWNGTPMGGNNVFVASPAQTSTYVLMANTNSITTNCSTTRTVQIVVNAIPTLSVTKTRATICKGETNTLTATGAASIVWQGTLGITNVITVKPTTTTTYTLIGTSAEGCTNTAQVIANVSSCNGIEDVSSAANITVYPNPNKGQFFIRAETATTLSLSNAIGQVLQQLELNADNGFKVEVNGLTKGLYFVRNLETKSVTKLIVE